MFSAYGKVLRIPGALAFSAAALVGRMPISMYGLSFVLLVQPISHSYAIAGLFSAAFTISTAIGAPFTSRLADRLGQHRVMPLATTVTTVSLAAAVALIVRYTQVDASGHYSVARWSVLLALLFTAVSGATVPNVGSYVRARWRYIVDSEDSLHTAFALESVLDEVVFVIGPPLATFIAVAYGGGWSLTVCAIFLVIGTVLLSVQRKTEPPLADHSDIDAGLAIRYSGMPALAFVSVLLGMMFGSYEVTTVAFATSLGHRSYAGILLAVWALGSGISGTIVGTVHFKGSITKRFLIQVIAMALLTIPMLFVTNAWQAGIALLIGGSAISPFLITSFTLVERLVPEVRFTEGTTWLLTSLSLGVALGAPLAGRVIDLTTAPRGYLVSFSAAVLAVVALSMSYRGLTRSVAQHLPDALPT
jgi:MFS family permease